MISEHAIIHSSAKIAKNVSIGPFTVIGPNVEIGEGTWVASHVVIHGPTTIGKNNKIFQFASIGEEPQDKKYHGEPTILTIGDNNVFRENTTVSRGTVQGGGKTAIGNDNLFMAYVHIAHDCIVGNNTTFSNNASLAGHVIVHDYANLSGMVGVHQFCTVGSYSFCAGGSIVVKDVPPFITVSGYPASAYGLNAEGLKRRGFTPEMISTLKQAYKILFRQGLSAQDAALQMEALVPECEWVQLIVDFVRKSARGIIR